MTKIQTKPFNFGDEKESTWPPLFGKGGSGVWYRDSETGEFKRGYPPRKENHYGNAPAIILDSMDPYYHPAAEIVVDSKSKLKDIDQACGTITSDKKLSPDPTWQNEQRARRKKDLTECLHKAVAQCDSGNMPLNEEQRAACTRENERISSALGFDAFNVVGRKNDPRGKRYKRRR